MGPHGNGEFDDEDDGIMMMPDQTSMRTHAFTELLRTSNSIRNAKLMAEAILMLQTIRSTIHVPPRGQLLVFTGKMANDDAAEEDAGEFVVGGGKLEKAPPPKKAPARPKPSTKK